MLNVLPNQTIPISPAVEVRDTGWTINGNSAHHSACNSGMMVSNSALGIALTKTYAVTYTVYNLVSGSVRVSLGTANGTSRTANGTYTENITCTGTPTISFFSDGELDVTNFNYYDVADNTDNSLTISFCDKDGENNKKWLCYYSFKPELMIKYKNFFFSVKDGQLWLHNVNPVRNNFYGVQYPSEVEFYDNLNPTTLKLYFSMRTKSTTAWYAKNNGDISILPTVGRTLGMSSRIKKGNFKNYQGDWFADFMRNMADTRFTDPEVALYKGEPLRGTYALIKLTNEDTVEAVLEEVDVKSSPSMLTY